MNSEFPRKRHVVATLGLISVMIVATCGSAFAVANTNTGSSTGGGGSNGIVNTDARTATDFHFVYKLLSSEGPPQYYYDSATFATIPAGTVTATPILVGGLIGGYTVDVTGLSIPTGGSISINANAQIHNNANHAQLKSWTFTYATGSPFLNCAPEWTYRFAYDAILPAPGRHTVHYQLFNDDLTRTITIPLLSFRLDTLWRPAGSPLPTSAPFQTANSIILPPGAKSDVILDVPATGSAKSFIYASGAMTYTGGGGSTPIPFDNRHEEHFYPASLPGLAPSGMVAVALMLVALGSMLLLKRRREEQA